MNFIKAPVYFIFLQLLTIFFSNVSQASCTEEFLGNKRAYFSMAGSIPIPQEFFSSKNYLKNQSSKKSPQISSELFDKASFAVWSSSPNEETESIETNEQLETLLTHNQYKLSVNFYEETVSHDDITALKPYASHIWGFNSDQTWMTDECMSLIASSFPNLRTLEIPNNCITGNALKTLSSLFHLEYLDIANNTLSAADLSSLLDFKKTLRSLSVSSIPIGEEGIKTLFQLDLEKLNVSSCDLTDSSLSYFLKMPHLKYLDIRRNSFTPNGLSDFLKYPHKIQKVIS
ncbi:MAG: hypothetical protein BGO76_05810 [Caedibacter sp. 38-128]|nr:MAG: hypothetical protein BGO76_05810 [Caedibacter sp. 38-128]